MHRVLTLVLGTALVLSLGFSTSAQSEGMEDVSFYALGQISLPLGDFGDFAGTGFGGGVGASMPFNEEINFRGEVGYTKFSGQDFGTGTSTIEYSASMIPIVALAEWHFDPTVAFYGLGGVGLFNMSFDIDTPPITTGFGTIAGVSGSTSSSEIGLVAGGGFAANEEIAIEARLNLFSDASQITVNGTYTF